MTIKDFKIYGYQSSEKVLVAVDKEYVPKIHLALREFGSLKNTPHDWEVRGIFIKEPEKFDPKAQQIEITISNLREPVI